MSALLAAAILICYWQTWGHEFVNYDDHLYITRNATVQQGLSLENVAWAFATFTAANWHPLTWLSHMLDVSLFGLNPGAHHFVNVLLHIVNTCLLLFLLRGMTGSTWRSAIVATLFALHPLRVESVAWVSERKDVLSVFFGLLAIRAYVRYAAADATRRLTRYALVVLFFACSLMSKPMLVTLPALLLVLDFWPLRRWSLEQTAPLRPLVLEKVPLLLMSVGSSVLTIMAQQGGGAMSSLEAVSLSDRIVNAIMAYAIYIYQTLWPVALSPLYLMPSRWPTSAVIGSSILLIVLTVVALITVRRWPHLIVGWLWYLGTLVPVIGLVQVGLQAHADRYTYFPQIGLLIMLAWGIPHVVADRKWRLAALATGGIVAATLMLLTWAQAAVWRDSITLSEHALRIHPKNYIAHLNLGNAFAERQEIANAKEHFEQVADLAPDWAAGPYNIGNLMLFTNQFEAAVAAYDEAIRRQPNHKDALTNRGIALGRLGHFDGGIASLQTALSISEYDPNIHMNLGWMLRESGQLQEGVRHLQAAVALDPADPFLRMMLARSLADVNRTSEALAHLQVAAELAHRARHQHPQLAHEVARLTEEIRTADPR